MTKKVPVITVAERDEAARLAGLPVEATLSLTDVAGAHPRRVAGLQRRHRAAGDAR